MPCRGICEKYADKKRSRGRYKMGQKRCSCCEKFILWDGVFCPCCRFPLRHKPRQMKYKEKLEKVVYY